MTRLEVAYGIGFLGAGGPPVAEIRTKNGAAPK